MEFIIELKEAVPVIVYRMVLFAAMLFALLMALIPSQLDPTKFINDKLKHAVTFFVLFFLLDIFAFPTETFALWKPVSLLVFGIIIEVMQERTGYRQFSVGDIVANVVGISCYCLFFYFLP